jgi:hypothetical protein
MCRGVAILLVWTTLAFGAAAQGQDGSRQEAGRPQAGADRASGLNAGATIQAELTKSLDAKKAKPGDPVTAKVTSDVSGGRGVAIPRGAKLQGHVLDAKPYGKGGTQSSLSIAFDRAVLKHHQEMPLRLVVQAVAPAAQSPTVGAADEGTADQGGMAPAGESARPMGGAAGGMGHAPGGNRNPSGMGGATNPAGGMAGSVAPVDLGGHLSTRASGALGLGGIALTPSQDATQGSLLTSTKGNVRLESGTQLVLRVVQ